MKEYCALSNWQETNCKALGRLLSGQACADDTNTTPTPGDDETCVDMNEDADRAGATAICESRNGIVLPSGDGIVCEHGAVTFPPIDACNNPYIEWGPDQGCFTP